MEEKIKYLINVYQNSEKLKMRNLAWLNLPAKDMTFWFDKQGRMNFSLDNKRDTASNLWANEVLSALYTFFIEGDLRKTKAAYFKCGRITEFLTRKYDVGILTYGRDHTAYVLLSDNYDLIHSFANLRFNKYQGSTFNELIEQGSLSLIYTIQSIIKNNIEGIEHGLFYSEKYATENKEMQLDVKFLKALVNNDRGKMEDILKKLVSAEVHVKRNLDPCISKFISHPALGYAKLAWLKGIEVKVNSPFIPKEWLPIQPLKDEEYVDYDFIKAYLG